MHQVPWTVQFLKVMGRCILLTIFGDSATKRIILTILIICALSALGIFVSWWFAISISLIILGTFGYLEQIFNVKWSRRLRVLLLILFVVFSGAYTVTNFIKSKHSERQIANLSSLYRPIEESALEHYPELPKEKAIKNYLDGINNIEADNKQLKEENSKNKQQISELTMKSKISEEMAYQEYALYNAFGWKKGISGINGIPINPTPLMDWNKDFASRSEGKISCNCTSTAIATCKSMTEKFPQYPFPYYFLSMCLKEKGDPSWRGYANTVKSILTKTTKMQNHNGDHDLIIIEVSKLLTTTS